ncbi:MAG: hypothetical protein ACREDS_04615 [Limisphaerales bacterium]
MDFHEVLRIAGAAGTLILFVPMAVEIVKTNGGGQSLSTWMLWTMLDTTLTISTIVRHGNFLLPLAYAIGGWILTTLLLTRVRFVWNRLDSVILALVVCCLACWKFGGAEFAIIVTTAAVCFAGIPGLIELWRNPQRAVGNIWAGYALANALAFFGGTAMTVEDRLAPGVFSVLSLVMFVAGRRESIFSK